jgi:hypothetical protein
VTAEKHHPASSKTARVRTTRAMRRQARIQVTERHGQLLRKTESTGYIKGARIRDIPNKN